LLFKFFFFFEISLLINLKLKNYYLSFFLVGQSNGENVKKGNGSDWRLIDAPRVKTIACGSNQSIKSFFIILTFTSFIYHYLFVIIHFLSDWNFF
jgi:hypothetical protein